MKLEKVTQAKRDNSKLEYMIWESLFTAKEELDVYKMTCDFIINAINLSERKAEEAAVAFNELFGLEKDCFGSVVTFAYYVSALQFWSQIEKESNPDSDMMEVIENVESEVGRCKDILFFYLMKGIEVQAFNGQNQMLRQNFNISETFHESLQQFLVRYHSDIIQQLILRLASE